MPKFTILVIDNDRAFRVGLADLLRLDYHVLEAGSVDEAKKSLRDNLIHLTVIDVRLTNDDDPNDNSGLRLCDEIEPLVARMIITGYTDDWKIVRDALNPSKKGQRVADGFYSKEWDKLDFLLDEIKRVLNEKFEIVPVRRIAVLTSGGDAPGMNTAIWSVVRTAMENNIEVIGVQDGYRGLINNQMYKLKWNDVSDISTEGGTILHTARCPEFKETEQRKKAIKNIRDKHISALIVIGGDGSMNGAKVLASDIEEEGGNLSTVAIPGTIDNDLLKTDMSLGAASAANAMIEQLRNMIRPAQALRRIFVVEVMGSLCGFLALQSAIGIGADAVLIPESIVEVSPLWDNSPDTWKEHVDINVTEAKLKSALKQIADRLRAGFIAGKNYGFVVLAEGINLSTKQAIEKVNGDGSSNKYLNANYVKELLQNEINKWGVSDPPDVRTQILGYPVRGVRPCRFDVWLGALMGQAAVKCLIDDVETNVMVGWEEERGVVTNPYTEVVNLSNQPPKDIWVNRTKWHSLLALQSSLSNPPQPPDP